MGGLPQSHQDDPSGGRYDRDGGVAAAAALAGSDCAVDESRLESGDVISNGCRGQSVSKALPPCIYLF